MTDAYLQPLVSCHPYTETMSLNIYNSSITDIEHFPNYTALGLPQTSNEIVTTIMCVCVCVCVCIYIYIYIHTHTHTHTHMHHIASK